jgi:uncharacterized protein (DUF1697 family)
MKPTRKTEKTRKQTRASGAERPAEVHVALLRGINVGGKNMLAMDDLVDVFSQEGCTDVRTYIQSGNVLFRAASRTVTGLSERAAARIQRRFGLVVPVA